MKSFEAKNGSPPSATPRAARGRARALLILFCLVAILGATAVGVVPWLFSTGAMRNEIVGEIRRLTGLSALAQGKAVFVILPQPHININAVRFADSQSALRIEAASLKGYLRVPALLRGRLEIASVTLVEPHLAINLDAAPIHDDSAIARAVKAPPASAQASSADAARLGVATIVNGSAKVESGGVETLVEDINVTIDWRRLGAPANVVGGARIRDRAAQVSAAIDRPAELMRGGSSGIRLTVEGPSLSLQASGELASAPKPQFAGRLAVAAPSLRALLQAAGYPLALPAPFEDFALRADVNIGAQSASLSNLRLKLDGNEYEGALAALPQDGRFTLSGTLAMSQLYLRPFFATLTPLHGRDGQWSREPFDLDEQDPVDLDLRISVGRLLLPGATFKEAAISLMKRERRLDVSLIEARTARGAIKGRASFLSSGGGLEVRLSTALADVEAAELWPRGVDAWRISGAVTGAVSLRGEGASMNELMRSFEGAGQATLRRGEIGGANLVGALRSLGKHPLGLAEDLRYGATGFDKAGFSARIAHGVADIRDGVLSSATVEVAFDGKVDLGERTADLHATAAAAGDLARPKAERAQFSFDVAGSWDDLALVPDAQSLIRASGAAAPLFERNSPTEPPPAPKAPAH